MAFLLQPLILFLISCLCACNALEFELLPNVVKCIKEEFRQDTLVSGSASISPSTPDLQLNMKITTSDSSVVFENRDLSQSSNYAFTSQHESEYAFCFFDAPRPNAVVDPARPRLVNLRIQTGGGPKDYTDLAKKENLKPLELELRKLEDRVAGLKGDFAYMKYRDAKHRDTSESTNSRVAWMTVTSLVILVCLGAGQIFYLKRFFHSKKLI